MSSRSRDSPATRNFDSRTTSEGPACRVRILEGPACQVRLLEGPARQVRSIPIDDPSLLTGHDKRAPPILLVGGTCLSGPFFSEGRACHVRRLTLDHPFLFVGHDKRAPPTSRRDLLVRSVFLGGTCSSGPPLNARSSIAFRRGLKSRAESGAKAPHSMECGDLSPLFGEGFSLHHLDVDPDGIGFADRGGTRSSAATTKAAPR